MNNARSLEKPIPWRALFSLCPGLVIRLQLFAHFCTRHVEAAAAPLVHAAKEAWFDNEARTGNSQKLTATMRCSDACEPQSATKHTDVANTHLQFLVKRLLVCFIHFH